MKRKYKIVIDSGCSLNKNLVDSLGLVEIPSVFTLNGIRYHDYHDNRELSSNNFYKHYIAGEKLQITAPSAQDFYDKFEQLIVDGYDIFYIASSSKILNNFSNAHAAIAKLLLEHGYANIFLYDSKRFSVALNLLVRYATKYVKEASPNINELEDALNHMVCKIKYYFISSSNIHHFKNKLWHKFNDLDALRIGYINENGEYIFLKKCLGWNNAIKQIFKSFEKECLNPTAFACSHNNNSFSADIALNMLKKRYPNCREISLITTRPTIASFFTGPTLAIGMICCDL
ncbi:MAG: DegV family protein [Bacilli bacterium]